MSAGLLQFRRAAALRDRLRIGCACPIGVQISETQYRILQLKRRGGRLVASAAARLAVNPDLSGFAAPSDLILRLQSALASGGFSGRRCVVSIPRSELFLQSIRMPSLPDEELAEAVTWEAAERFDLKRDDLQVDFIRLGVVDRGRGPQSQGNAIGVPTDARAEILLIAAKRSVLHNRLDPLVAVGLRPIAVDTGFLAAARFYSILCRRTTDRTQVRAMLEMGRGGSIFMILHGDQVALCKPIPIGGHHLDQSVADHLAIDFDLASELRRKRIMQRISGEGTMARRHAGTKAGTEAPRHEGTESCGPFVPACLRAFVPSPAVDQSTDRAIFEAVRALMEQMIKEIGLCLRYYGVTFRGRPPDRLILAGSDSFEPNFDEMLSRACPDFSGSVLMDDPLSPVGDLLSSMEGVIDTEEPPHAWAIAAGLSLREVAARSEGGMFGVSDRHKSRLGSPARRAAGHANRFPPRLGTPA